MSLEARHFAPPRLSGCEVTPLTDSTLAKFSGVGSTKGSIQLSKEAAEAGADFAIVIPSGYYAGALGRDALKKYFIDVAEASPIPVMVYNCQSSLPVSCRHSMQKAHRQCSLHDSPRRCGWNRHGFGLDYRHCQGLVQHLRSQADVSRISRIEPWKSRTGLTVRRPSVPMISCGAVGKLTRITAATTSEEFQRDYPRRNPQAP